MALKPWPERQVNIAGFAKLSNGNISYLGTDGLEIQVGTNIGTYIHRILVRSV